MNNAEIKDLSIILKKMRKALVNSNQTRNQRNDRQKETKR